uniref:Cytochrome b5 heme-binding domain-containing protein n=1 Tax=Phaeomonas parva TaxID=124430 RepID=A0A7S1UHH4_9STRA|mmetsp:Transcript_5005/g.14175  ORF Transcript_5005/g.14175 Transcript_5005/m.14175 type:complete len:145 (+) Transcript_5005:102-536(+)|eukprot:CAMPEP_0118865830 /NCGR_PEP_ID=MMETSP1163-20130328/9958_1 /TAXON_ID=124430 /ORGANISM="Phaeomonas parva, Strain CCMP2877" /LENGTH=144 /DNA_ID=CAMNT_0006800095 /DNA_START=56 /DNA_END=490 /DNA_ORIENTATION=+
MAPSNEKTYTWDEVKKHSTAEDCWIVVGNETNGGPKVYDVSKYLESHPGGSDVIEDVAGEDADESFEDMGHSEEARNIMRKYLVGTLFLTEEEKAAMEAKKAKAKSSGGMNIMMLIALIAIAIGVYTQIIAKQEKGAAESDQDV